MKKWKEEKRCVRAKNYIRIFRINNTRNYKYIYIYLGI